MKLETYNTKLIFAVILLFSIFLFSIPVSAAGLVPCGQGPPTITQDGVAVPNPAFIPCTVCHFFVLIQNIINDFIIPVSASLATLAAIYIAFLFMFSGGSPAKITDAKGKLWLVIIGIFWVLGSWLVLNTILNFIVDQSAFPWAWNKINCEVSQSSSALGGASVSGGGGASESGGDAFEPGGGAFGGVGASGGWEPTLSEQEARNDLQQAGITVNKGACPSGVPYQNVAGGCTSLDGVKTSAIEETIQLKKDCNCAIEITGGTELGYAEGTTSHASGNKLDLKPNSALDQYIQSNFTYIGLRSDGAKQYRAPDGTIMAKEGDHWDATFIKSSNCKAQGEMCGGIGGFVCCTELSCVLDGDYPDASGTCVSQALTIVLSFPKDGQIFSEPSIHITGAGMGNPTKIIVEADSREYLHSSYSVEATITPKQTSFVFEAQLPLVIGVNEIRAIAYSSNGQKTSTEQTQVLYLISPDGEIFPPASNSCLVSPVSTTMSGFAQFGSLKNNFPEKVLPTVTINGFNADVNELQTFVPRKPGERNYAGHYDVPLDLGKNTINATTTDRYKQTTLDSITVWRLTLDVGYPKQGQIINQSPITARGGGSGNPDRIAVSVNNIDAVIYPNGPDFYTFEAPISFPQEGPQTITVVACDKFLCIYPEHRIVKTINVTYVRL